MRKALCLAAALAIRPLTVLAYSGVEGAAFLEIPVGAAPAAMGGAYSALASDAYAPVYNPAGLGEIRNTQVAAQHLSYVESLHYEAVSFGMPFKERHGFGAAAQYVGSGNLDRTDESGARMGRFDNYFAAASLSYGLRVSQSFSAGASARLIRGKLDDVSATAAAGDAGLMLRTSENSRIAAVVSNFGGSLKFISQNDPLPLAYKLGAAMDVLPMLTLAAEGIARRSKLFSGHAGLELRPIQSLALRAGYRTDTIRELSALAGVTAGVGVKIWGHEFAYAWLPLGDLGTTNYFSILLSFGQPTDRYNLREPAEDASY